MTSIQEDYPLVLFRIKKELYAVTSRQVQAMTEVPDVIPVPHSPSYVRGLINLRGKVIPLLDLRLRLGMETLNDERGDEASEIVLVLETPGFEYSVTVDAVEAVEFLEEGSVQDLPLDRSITGQELVGSTLGRRDKDGSVVQILDVDRICNSDDAQALEEAAAQVN